jgi:predicted RNA-binding protein with EMAP domain
MDTAKDGRVLVLEDALRRLTEVVTNRKLKMHIDYGKLAETLKTAGALLYEVKYSYSDAPALADLPATANLIDAISTFGEIYNVAKGSGHKPSTVKEQLAHVEVEYALRIVNGFQNRLREFDDDPGKAVDLLAVEISSTKTVEGSKNLTECRCTDGSRIWRIVTNISDVKEGSKLACAVLPPVEMMDIVSEAMFLGNTPLPEDAPLGPLTSPPESSLDQARAQVMQLTKRMT